MKTYKVTWNEMYLCTRYVKAESAESALEIAQDDEYEGGALPDEKVFGGYDFWEAEEVKG